MRGPPPSLTQQSTEVLEMMTVEETTTAQVGEDGSPLSVSAHLPQFVSAAPLRGATATAEGGDRRRHSGGPAAATTTARSAIATSTVATQTTDTWYGGRGSVNGGAGMGGDRPSSAMMMEAESSAESSMVNGGAGLLLEGSASTKPLVLPNPTTQHRTDSARRRAPIPRPGSSDSRPQSARLVLLAEDPSSMMVVKPSAAVTAADTLSSAALVEGGAAAALAHSGTLQLTSSSSMAHLSHSVHHPQQQQQQASSSAQGLRYVDIHFPTPMGVDAADWASTDATLQLVFDSLPPTARVPAAKLCLYAMFQPKLSHNAQDADLFVEYCLTQHFWPNKQTWVVPTDDALRQVYHQLRTIGQSVFMRQTKELLDSRRQSHAASVVQATGTVPSSAALYGGRPQKSVTTATINPAGMDRLSANAATALLAMQHLPPASVGAPNTDAFGVHEIVTHQRPFSANSFPSHVVELPTMRFEPTGGGVQSASGAPPVAAVQAVAQLLLAAELPPGGKESRALLPPLQVTGHNLVGLLRPLSPIQVPYGDHHTHLHPPDKDALLTAASEALEDGLHCARKVAEQERLLRENAAALAAPLHSEPIIPPSCLSSSSVAPPPSSHPTTATGTLLRRPMTPSVVDLTAPTIMTRPSTVGDTATERPRHQQLTKVGSLSRRGLNCGGGGRPAAVPLMVGHMNSQDQSGVLDNAVRLKVRGVGSSSAGISSSAGSSHVTKLRNEVVQRPPPAPLARELERLATSQPPSPLALSRPGSPPQNSSTVALDTTLPAGRCTTSAAIRSPVLPQSPQMTEVTMDAVVPVASMWSATSPKKRSA